MDGLWNDLRYGLRALNKNRGFAIVAVLMLALGIGANTAVFSLTDQVLLRLLPVQDPEELVVLRSPGGKRGRVWSDIDDGAQSFSYLAYKELRDKNEVFSGLLARFSIAASVAGAEGNELTSGELVSGNYFQVLGLRPALGRLFAAEDETTPGASPVAVLGHNFWVRRYGSNPGIVNQTLVVNGHRMTIVGVAPPGFQGVQVGQVTDVYVPITMKPLMTPNWDGLNNRRDYWLQMMGRRKPGLSMEQAESGLQPLHRSILEQEAAESRGWKAENRDRFLNKKLFLVPGGQGRKVLQHESTEPLLFLSALVGLVLLIACANVANLLIARGVARQREIAVRLALGAQRGHLVRQLLAEGMLLALAGGIAGVVIASWTIDGLLAILPPDFGVEGLSSKLDARLLLFNFGAAALTGLLFALIPALRTTRPDLVGMLKEQGAGGSQGRGHVRLRKGLVVSQIAFTAVVLIAAGLFARSLRELKHVDLGFHQENILSLSLAPQLNSYKPETTAALFEELRQGLAALPGVSRASGAYMGVMTDNSSGSNITAEGYQAGENEDTHVFLNWVGPGFFSTMGVPILAGREITEADTASSPKVAIINEAMSRHFFKGRDPIGMHFGFGAGDGIKLDIEIVGVVRNNKHARVREEEREFVYMPFVQNARADYMTFYLRSSRDPGALAAEARQVVRRRDAALPVFQVKTLERQIEESLFADRLLSLLSASFGGLASLLAAVGLYGLMAYTVARRTREIGIRIALGASQGNVSALVVREAMILAALGLLLGLPVAVAAGKLAESFVYGVKGHDPLLLGAATLLLVGVMLVAAYLPARRASRVDPVVALRYE